MYTQCPDCLTVFSLDVDVLARARGQVACGYCGIEFDAMASLTGQLPAEPFRLLPPQAASDRPPSLELAVYRPRPDPPAVAGSDAVAAAPETAPDFAQMEFAPRFIREQQGRVRTHRRRPYPREPGERRWPWVAACVVLSLLLGMQLAWVDRDALIRDPAVGGWLRNSCVLLHCELPLVAAPHRLRLLASNVQAHPSVPGALMISASVRNEAAFAQPYPIVTIILSDARGRHVAMRRLRPREYLDDDEILQRGMAPGASTVLLFEVEDPGDKAVAFEINFE
ncbi:MAG: zinc-ribbon and DUF3426 domain-containing protein [Xanthomonadaceae bacterium]|nr:zinc-ribbon and DUF3426 domain-containing protein [Xanthomonadaceae bacterium]MDE3072152.1 zinc-ribbon and DUF3426 domain-containing protein [Pseudomonadota bacterium]